jgi:hypothetical protein
LESRAHIGWKALRHDPENHIELSINKLQKWAKLCTTDIRRKLIFLAQKFRKMTKITGDVSFHIIYHI